MPKQDPSLDNMRREIELENKRLEGSNNEENKVELYNVTERDIAEIKRVMTMYSNLGDNTIDCGTLPEALRALELNPTKALMERAAGTTKPGEKRFTETEFVAIYSQVRGSKDICTYEDFVTCLQMWDRERAGLMPLADLEHALTKMGERLSDEEMESVLADCIGSEDADGNIHYLPFLAKICDRPIPKNVKPKQ